MNTKPREIQTELAIIGTGLAGVAASIFAMNRGISVAQVGNTGALAYTTGYLDLLGSVGDTYSAMTNDPWSMLKVLRDREPMHPLSRVSDEDIRASFTEFTDYISKCGISYTSPGVKNVQALTPAGTIKHTMCVPETMQHGVEAYNLKKRSLIIDFKGLRGFSGRQIVANMKRSWPTLSCERIDFPAVFKEELYPEVLARTLEVRENRVRLADAVKPLVNGAEYIGMPAVFGMYKPDRVMKDLQEMIGVPMFEIPTMPPSVPGIRLREMVEQAFPQKGAALIPQQKILNVSMEENGLRLHLEDNFGSVVIHARDALLATGRFISGGLTAKNDGINESLLNIPVTQPESREGWYGKEYMGSSGHGIHRAGIEVDEMFRPLDHNGNAINEHLYGAGIILAHQDWIRSRCGAGVAITSAYKVIDAIIHSR